LGTAIWAGTAIGAGALFHDEIDRLLAVMNGLGSIAFAALGVLLAGYVATKWWQRHGTLGLGTVVHDYLSRSRNETRR